ncbi:MAG: hypothetical protein QOG87_1761 [Actinomycetota bacterium]|jgi:hypothetical protein
MAFLPLAPTRTRNDNGVMHPFQMDTLAKQRWDELVMQGSATRHNTRRRRRARINRRNRFSRLLGLVVGRPMGWAPRRDRRTCEVATLP